MVTIMEGQQEGAEVNIGLAAASLISIVVGAAGVVWLRRGRQPGAKGKEVEEKKVKEEKMVKVEEEKDEEFKEIQLMLQQSLNGNISSRLESTKSEMRVKRLELERRVAMVRREEEEELEMLEEKHRKEREEVELRYQKDVEELSEDFRQELDHLVDSLRKTKLVLASCDETVEAEVVEQSRGELECPVCMEPMRPPRRIWQCSDGHPVCEFCRKKPQVNCCPTCRKYLVGRSTIAEKLARALYQEDPLQEDLQATEEKKITLTGYKEVKPESLSLNT